MFSGSRRLRVSVGPSICAAAILSIPHAAAVGQDAPSPGLERGVAVVQPDTVRVGEVFELGLTAVSRDRVQFPALLPLSDELEQVGPPRLQEDGNGTWRAIYPLVGWKSGRLPFPLIRVPVIGGREERVLEISPPGITVTSVLPAASEPARLLPPRLPDESRRFSWNWLLALLLAALLAREILRGRRTVPVPPPMEEETGPDPYREAREHLLRLREQVAAGPVDAAILYDEVELVVRRFLVRTRGWPEQQPVRNAFGAGLVGADQGSAPGAEGVVRAVRRALPARFGALEVSRGGALADLDSVLAWLNREEAA
jgi:hypothetical protein